MGPGPILLVILLLFGAIFLVWKNSQRSSDPDRSDDILDLTVLGTPGDRGNNYSPVAGAPDRAGQGNRNSSDLGGSEQLTAGGERI